MVNKFVSDSGLVATEHLGHDYFSEGRPSRSQVELPLNLSGFVGQITCYILTSTNNNPRDNEMKLSDCAFCLPNFSGGGAERVFANLISEFVRRDRCASGEGYIEKMNNGKKDCFWSILIWPVASPTVANHSA